MRRAILVLLAIISLLPLAAESFTMERNAVDMTVSPSRAASVHEEMDVFFTSPSHGIIRDIQTSFPGVKARVSSIRGNAVAETERSGGFVSVIMGDADRYIEGPASFTLSYGYDLGKDRYPDYDEYYYNIVSPAWGTVIRDVEFTVRFPYPVDKDRVWLTYGPDGSTAMLPVSVSEDGCTVSGRYSGLPPYNAITLRVEMDEGYFDGMGPMEAIRFIPLASSVLMAAIMLLVYIRGRDEKVIAPVKFEPPAGITPFDAEYIYRGAVTSDSAAAGLIYLADKGYMSIEPDGRGFRFHRKKEISGEGEAMSHYSAALFPNGPESDTKMLRLSRFADVFSASIPRDVAAGLADIYDASSIKVQRMALAAAAAFSAISSLAAGYISGEPMLALFMAVPLFMLYMVLSSRTTPAAMRIFITIFLSVFIIMPFSMLLGTDTAIVALPPYLAAIFAAFAIPRCRRYSDKGRALRAAVIGYREFIDKVEADRIRRLSDSDPLFFYHVLPYAMVFGLADRWCDKFRSISVPTPDWYAGSCFSYRPFRSQWASGYSSMHAPGSTGGGRSTFRGSSGSAGGGFSGGGGRCW